MDIKASVTSSGEQIFTLETIQTRETPAIVSTEWLEQSMDNPRLVILDIRAPEDYMKGHIPMAVNVPASSFIVTRNGLLLEIPEKEDLFKTIGSSGVSKDSIVVIVHLTNNPYLLADAARTAFTLIYAGVRNVSVLTGGIDKWKLENKPLSVTTVAPKATAYTSEVYSGMIVTKDYVEQQIGKTLIVDARDPGVYFGVSIEPFAPRPGHIPTAVNLPTPWFWTPEGMYKEKSELLKMVEGIVGTDTAREIIVYCGVGGYGSVSWFVQHEVLGYANVKLYDGSAQEWVSDLKAPLSSYSWK